MFENIRLAVKGIWSHRMRSFLTMLGIIIGIASIISIVSTIRGTNEQIKENLIGAGNNNVDVKLSQGDSEYYMDQGNPDGIMPVTKEIKKEIRNIKGVVSATFYNKRNWAEGITYKNTTLDNGAIYGIDTDFLRTKGYVLQEGRGFVEDDYSHFSKIVLLDDVATQTLFPDETAIGKIIEIKGEPFTVVGTIRKSDAFEPVINSMEDYYMYNQNSNGMILIPQADWPIIYNFDEPCDVSVMAENTDIMSSIGKKVEDIMNTLVVAAPASEEGEKNTSLSYRAADLLKTVKDLQKVSESTNKQLLWIASISLLVGGIGVMNIMLVSVTERTREIGLKKAIGARKKKILWQFLTEAAVLTSVGGILGVIVGIIMSQVIAKMSQTPVAISVPASILAVVFSMVIGIIFGLLPSIKAANLNPIDALRYE